MNILANPRVMNPVPVKGRRVIVVGAGVSGMAAARLLCRLGATVIVTDAKHPSQMTEQARALADLRIKLVCSAHDLRGMERPELAVVSPGIPPSASIVRDLRERHVPIIGELEFAWQYCPARVAAITGTNGKGTTCRLAHAILTEAGLPSVLAGNIGAPLADYVADLSQNHIVVLEVSSFQLMTTQTFSPEVAAVLNISEDHLDWHKNMEEYVGAKRKIFEGQHPHDLSIVVTDDPGAASLLEAVRARLVKVSEAGPAEVTWDGENVKATLPGLETVRVFLPELALWGTYHRIDALVATAIALHFEAKPQHVRSAIQNYSHPQHLMTPVAEVNRVRYIDDSKATNVASAVADIRHLAIGGPIIVITGGKDKGVDLLPWAEALSQTAKAVVLIGETAPQLEQLITRVPVEIAPTMEDAVKAAIAKAEEGDTVALIPATSSQDMFADYADRGRCFEEAVKRYAPGRKTTNPWRHS
jgi:UDP-N-acetylmuramoylalanine--D-glutamate ligase